VIKISALIILISNPAMAQWRDIKISSPTDMRAIQENLRRASLWSNRKLDRFSNDILYGQPVFKNGVKFGDGTTQTTAVSGDVVLASTQTFTGQNTFTKLVNVSSTAYISMLSVGQSVAPTQTLDINGSARINDTLVSRGTLYLYGSSTSTIGVEINGVGIVDMGWESIVSEGDGSATRTATCSAGKKITGCSGYCNGGTVALLYFFSDDTVCYISCAGTSGNRAQANCLRVK